MNFLAWLRLLWCLAIVASLVALFGFRSPDTHGPDMVGREVSAFVGPLVVALILACTASFARRGRLPPATSRTIDTPLVTIIIGAVEVLLYCTVVVR